MTTSAGSPTPAAAKREIRRVLLAARRGIPVRLRRRRSREIARRLESVSAWARARTIFAYAATGAEADCLPLLRAALRQGRAVALPRVRPGGSLEFHRISALEDLAPGAFGIPEPPPGRGTRVVPGAADVILVPGVGFSSDGMRLGRGGGYYDRALARRGGAVAVGLGFEVQILSDLPREAHDARLDALVTESKVRLFGAVRPQSLRSSASVPPTKNWATASP